MYIPKLRRIAEALKEIKKQDPDTVLTRHFIEELIHKNEITALKYGDAWLINLDELYYYMTAQKDDYIPQENTYPLPRQMVSSGELFRLFVENDTGTIVRRPNLRRFVKSNGIHYFVNELGYWVIDGKDFLQKVNPKNISFTVKMPRMRWHDDSVRNFQRRHPNIRITLKMLEEILRTDEVFSTLNGRRWILNYDELEKEALSKSHKIITQMNNYTENRQ